MTLSNDAMIQRFLEGVNIASASRMQVQTIESIRCIVGYGHAVYCAEAGGQYALFGDGYATDGSAVGWSGYSGPTTKHIQRIKGWLETNREDYVVVDRRPQTDDIDDEDWNVSKMIAEDAVEAQEYTGYYYQR